MTKHKNIPTLHVVIFIKSGFKLVLSRLYVIKLLDEISLKGFPKRHFQVLITFPDNSSPCLPCSNRHRVLKTEFQKDHPVLFTIEKMQYSSQIPSKVRRRNFQNAALFVRLDLPSTLIRHENGAFRKRSSNRRNLKTLAFRFRVDGKHFERSFLKTMTSWLSRDFPAPVFLKHKSRMTGTGHCCVF